MRKQILLTLCPHSGQKNHSSSVFTPRGCKPRVLFQKLRKLCQALHHKPPTFLLHFLKKTLLLQFTSRSFRPRLITTSTTYNFPQKNRKEVLEHCFLLINVALSREQLMKLIKNSVEYRGDKFLQPIFSCMDQKRNITIRNIEYSRRIVLLTSMY